MKTVLVEYKQLQKNKNSKFFELINSFYLKSNIPILLNTSFNENEPIVYTPKEALDCFIRTRMDNLILENYFFFRRENNLRYENNKKKTFT